MHQEHWSPRRTRGQAIEETKSGELPAAEGRPCSVISQEATRCCSPVRLYLRRRPPCPLALDQGAPRRRQVELLTPSKNEQGQLGAGEKTASTATSPRDAKLLHRHCLRQRPTCAPQAAEGDQHRRYTVSRPPTLNPRYHSNVPKAASLGRKTTLERRRRPIQGI